MSPAQQLADALLERRAAGIPFEFAWGVSLSEVQWPQDRVERGEWRQALAWARSEFQDAYDRPHSLPAFVQRVLQRPVEGALPGDALARLAAASGDLRLLGAPVR